ncbi:MAG: Fe(3+) ABC transporter substrate-binding protein [Cyclobacteriaceae bacterium]|nr:Fe(3+) ABC transporter substrate-binding protein [Cyclobacteriaceae bacterium]MCH8514816.1 Fe(3+) ABC transporter substrate-binding protein [Cyclobacteriaceae bacterium]
MRFLLAVLLMSSILFACGGGNESSESSGELNIYTHRHYEVDQQIFKKFEENTGIKVNVVSAGADELIKKLEMEGKRSPADILITADAGRLVRAKEIGLTQSLDSEVINNNIPTQFRDADSHWLGLTYRARVIVYNPDKVSEDELSTYEDLTSEKWRNRVVMRSSENIYNQSLLASIIANDGEEQAREWTKALVANFARAPKGNDRDQIKFVASGEGDVTLVNTYYLGKMAVSDNAEEQRVAKEVGIFFPNQNDRGTHINISGAALTRHSPNKENAIQLLEYLVSEEVQEVFAAGNHEYPTREGIAWSDIVQGWGDFKKDELDLNQLGTLNRQAVIIFDEAGWK